MTFGNSNQIMLGMLLVFALAAPLPVAEYGDSLLFIAGFNAYLREEYDVAVENLNRVIKEYPGSPFRDMSLFCLARASYLTGDHQEAARAISLFLREYPDHPLKGTVEDNLLKLAAQHNRGETIARAPGPRFNSNRSQNRRNRTPGPESPGPTRRRLS